VLEVIGTGTLIYSINMTGVHPLGTPFILLAILMATGPISGGHLNPAVTTAVFVIKYKEWKTNIGWTVLYLTAEYLGGILGIGMASLSKAKVDGSVTKFPQFKPAIWDGSSITVGGCWFTEFFCTFWFVFTIMHAKEARLTSNF
jgi:glycerol uptake facilitator-like aquaporin